MEKQQLISKFDRTNRVIYIISLLFLVGLAIGCFSNYNLKDVTTTFYLLGSMFFLFFAFLIAREIYNSPTIVIQSDKFELVRIFNIKTDTFELQHIQSWLNRKKKSKNGDYEILYLIFSDKSRLKIKSYNYCNFNQLEQKLIQNKAINHELEKELSLKENKQYSFAFILIGLVFLGITAKNYEYKNLSSSDISLVKGHVSEPLKIQKERRSETLIIKLSEFPEFNFRVAGMSLDETYYEDLMNDFHIGQTLEFAIRKEDYDKKIAKTSSLTIWELIFHYDNIHIVEIVDNDFKYLSLEDYNRVHNSNNKSILGFFGILGLLLTLGGIVIFIGRTK